MNSLLPGAWRNVSNIKLTRAGHLMRCKTRTVQLARHYATESESSSSSNLSEPSSPNSSARGQRSNREKKQRHIMFLQGVPISALPSDIERLLKFHDIGGHLKIQRDYIRFWPTDSVLVTFGSLGERDKAIKALKHAKMLGLNLEPTSTSAMEEAPEPDQPSKRPRLRGREGKSKLLDKGTLSGDGPGAGLPDSESGKNVVLSGLPGKLYANSLKKELLEEFNLREDVTAVVKVSDLNVDTPLYSRFVIRTSSIAEAHRLVRAVKMKPYLEGAWGNRYKIKARVIY